MLSRVSGDPAAGARGPRGSVTLSRASAGAVGSHAFYGIDHNHYSSAAIGPLELLTEEPEGSLLQERDRLRAGFVTAACTAFNLRLRAVHAKTGFDLAAELLEVWNA